MKTAGKRKITLGWVTQVFDDEGKCVEQEFFAGDEVTWEDQSGEPICPPGATYQSFDMVQPGDDLEEMKRQLAVYEAEDYDRQQGVG